jgi:hypothetical protein
MKYVVDCTHEDGICDHNVENRYTMQSQRCLSAGRCLNLHDGHKLGHEPEQLALPDQLQFDVSFLCYLLLYRLFIAELFDHSKKTEG